MESKSIFTDLASARGQIFVLHCNQFQPSSSTSTEDSGVGSNDDSAEYSTGEEETENLYFGTPLDASKSEIRPLLLHAFSGGPGRFSCHMKSFSLTETVPPFTSLSYAWGIQRIASLYM
jgi:hypothetical protein